MKYAYDAKSLTLLGFFLGRYCGYGFQGDLGIKLLHPVDCDPKWCMAVTLSSQDRIEIITAFLRC